MWLIELKNCKARCKARRKEMIKVRFCPLLVACPRKLEGALSHYEKNTMFVFSMGLEFFEALLRCTLVDSRADDDSCGLEERTLEARGEGNV